MISLPPVDSEDEISSLIATLHDAERRLEELTGGEVDTVSTESGQPFLLRRAQAELRSKQAAKQAAILNALPAQIALLDAQGVIVTVNEAWRQFATANNLQWPEFGVGVNYLETCDRARGDDSADAHQSAAGIRSVLAGTKTFSLEYPCHSPTEQHWFQMTVAPLTDVVAHGVVVMHVNVTERRQAENALRMSETRLIAAQAVAKVGSWETDLITFAVHWSAETHRIFETDPARFAPSHAGFLGIVHSEDRAAVDRAFQQSVATRGANTIEHRLLMPDGRVKFVEERWQVLSDAAARPLRAIGTCQDITERKRLEARLRRLVDSDAHAVIFWNTKGEITDANDAFLSLTRYSRDDLKAGRINWMAMTPPEYAHLDRRALGELAATGVCTAYEKEWICRNGSRVPILLGAAMFDDNPQDGVCFVIDISERKRAETAMRESNLKFQQLTDNITDAFWIRSPDFSELHYVSPAFERIWGRSVASLQANPKQWVDFVLPEDRERVVAAFAALTERAPSLEIEYRIVRPDGELRWVRVRGFQVRNAEDQLVRHIGIVTDITAKMQAATELRTSLAEFRQLAESMPQIVWITTADGRNTFFSQQWIDYTGLTLAESLGHGWLKPFHPEDQAQASAAWQNATATGGIYSVESRLRRADGAYRWWLVRGVPQRDAAGNILKWFGTCTDVHDMKLAGLEIAQTNRALQQQQAELRVLIDLMPATIMFKDTANIYRRVNQRFAKSAGRPVSELEGRSTAEIFERDAARYDAEDLTVMNSGKPELGLVRSSRDRQGNEVWHQIDKVPVCEVGGNVVGLVIMAQDISERRRTEVALQVSEERFRFLTALADATRTLASPDQIMSVATRMLGELLGVSRCAYAEVDKDGERFTILSDWTDGCVSTVGNYQLSLFGARAVATLNHGHTLTIRDVEAELLPSQGADMFKAIGIKAIITCPLVKEGGLRAMMAVHQSVPRDWQPSEIAIVQEVSTRCWATIERQTAEDKLRKSEAMLRIAAWTARLGGWSIELPEFRIFWSDEVCAILEVPPGTAPTLEQAVGFYAPESREAVSQAIAACAELGTPFDLELEIITAKGNRIGVRATGEAVRNAAGVITLLQGAFQDITERKKIADELRASEKRFKALFDQAAVGVAQTEAATGRFVQVNQRFCEMLGRSREELEQVTFAALTHPHDIALSLDIVRHIKAGTRREFTAEKRYLRKDGSEVWANVTVSAMWAPGDVPDYFIAVAQDVTERKKLEDQVRQAQKMDAIGTLAGGIAHDFNNVLAAINGYTELAKLQLTENPKVRDYLGSVLEASKRATDLVRQILTFSRHERPERRPIQLRPVVVEALKLLRASIPSTIEFDLTLATDAPVVLADATQVHQILMNLGTNAWHAMKDRPGRLQVKLETQVVDDTCAATHARLRTGVYAHISVSDTGSGMDAATLRRIFEPFFTTKPVGEGTGLGLAVVHGIMANHDGAVTVYSQPGAGTVFHLYFPAHVGDATAAIPDEGTTPRGNGELVLFIDDEVQLTKLGQRILTALGYAVEVAQDPLAALELVRADPTRFALVITDQTMPGMTGLMLASELQRIRPGLQVILMTGYGLALTPDRVEAAGVRQLLIKPTTIHSLGTAVHAALSARPPH